MLLAVLSEWALSAQVPNSPQGVHCDTTNCSSRSLRSAAQNIQNFFVINLTHLFPGGFPAAISTVPRWFWQEIQMQSPSADSKCCQTFFRFRL